MIWDTVVKKYKWKKNEDQDVEDVNLLVIILIIFHKYLPMWYMNCKMVIIKDKGCEDVIKVQENYLFVKDILFVFIIYLLWVITLFAMSIAYKR